MRVLCFGDSLTTGWLAGGCKFWSYAQVLGETYHLKTDVYGYPGYTTGQLCNKITKVEDADRDWAVILGGTNDLAHGVSTGTVVENLEDMYSWAASKGMKVCTVTIPPLAPDIVVADINKKRDDVNDAIKRISSEKGYPCADFYTALKATAAEDPQGDRYFDDNVHMSEEGYRLLGDTVGKVLVA